MDEKKLKIVMNSLRWEAFYRQRKLGKDIEDSFLPEIISLDNDFSNALCKYDLSQGKLLEVGCGLGSQAVQYAHLGFEVTATDVSDAALAQASALALKHNVTVSYLKDNILSSELNESFDIIVDRGCFTLLRQDVLGLYAENVYRLLGRDGFFLIKMDKKERTRIEPLRAYFNVVESVPGHYQEEEEKDVNCIKSMFFVLRPM